MGSVIIDYNSGNLHSVKKSFQLVSEELGRGKVTISNDPEIVIKADRIILPGVGAFHDCKSNLIKQTGLMEAIEQRVTKDGAPFLGICVGHQLMASIGLENNIKTEGFNWIPGRVERINPANPDLKVPHMGWNTLCFDRDHQLFNGINENDHVYFVHSYHVILDNPNHRVSYTQYSQDITAAVIRANMIGTQFHPEKSQAVGLTFIRNFLNWSP